MKEENTANFIGFEILNFQFGVDLFFLATYPPLVRESIEHSEENATSDEVTNSIYSLKIFSGLY